MCVRVHVCVNKHTYVHMYVCVFDVGDCIHSKFKNMKESKSIKLQQAVCLNLNTSQNRLFMSGKKL